MGLRRKSRESAIKILYQTEMTGYEVENCIVSYWENLGNGDDARDFCNSLVRGVTTHQQEIDDKISKYSSNWTISRINRLDLLILRTALFEMLYCEDIPVKVSINEAIEMAKKFGTDDSPSFINGVLGKIAEVERFSRKGR